MWFYNSQFPTQPELMIFGVMMILEYYSMLYVRSKATIQFFPRFSFLLFLLYHFYLYSFPAGSGFDMLAVNVMLLGLLYSMLFCLRTFEVPAFNRGEVSIDQPRALYNSLPWPTWAVSLATDDTIFMPVNRYSTSVYADAPNPLPPPAGIAAGEQHEAPQEGSATDHAFLSSLEEWDRYEEEGFDDSGGGNSSDVNAPGMASTSIFSPLNIGSGYMALNSVSESRGGRS
jgi:hypothetical protein